MFHTQIKKSSFFLDTIKNFTLVICPKHMELDLHARDGIRGLQPPASITDLHSVLGSYNAFQRFFPSFYWIAAPINQCLMEDNPVSLAPLNSDELHTIETLKNALISSALLTLSNLSELMARGMFKLAASYYRNNWKIQSNQSGISTILLLTLKRTMTQPNANTLRLYGPSFFHD